MEVLVTSLLIAAVFTHLLQMLKPTLPSMICGVPLALVLTAAGVTAYGGTPLVTNGLWINSLSLIFASTVSLLALLVFRFASRYLQGDSTHDRFFRWGHFTVASVLTMTLMNNLVLFGLAWMATSYGLHRLLTLHGNRPEARRVARTKFVVSRIGDLSLLAAGFLLYQSFGTLELSALADHVRNVDFDASAPLQWVGALIVLGAMTKSAQVPFHAWLPETIEAPTPVSAFMHAGVINAGGYLILRSYDLVHLTRWAPSLLCLIGVTSMVICGLTLLTSVDAKRRLAHSTSAQMGFMFVQIGLGMPGAALVHMIGHGFFKAYAFLSSGALPSPEKQSLSSTASPFASLALTGLGLLPVVLHLAGIGPSTSLASAASTSLLAIAFLDGCRLVLSARQITSHQLVQIGSAAFGVTLIVLAGRAMNEVLGEPMTGRVHLEDPATLAIALTLTLFVGLVLLQNLLPRMPFSITSRLYPIARNGFYADALARKFLSKQ